MQQPTTTKRQPETHLYCVELRSKIFGTYVKSVDVMAASRTQAASKARKYNNGLEVGSVNMVG